MKKHSIVVAVIAAVLVAGTVWSWPRLQGLWPAIGPAAPLPSVSSSATPSVPLTAAPGWTATLLTNEVPGARDMALDEFGNVWVSQTSQGTVSLVYLHDLVPGDSPVVAAVLRDLDRPHGLAFRDSLLYVATETAIKRLPTYGDGDLEDIASLPEGGRHFTRSLAFGPDRRLYVSIGSACDVCHETNLEVATIISMKEDGSERRTEATGLRNAVFIAFHPKLRNIIFATEMGRDRLGDNLPPDEINSIETGAASGPTTLDYGWPICYGDRVHDSQFDTNVYIRDPCADTIPPIISLPAHVAPLGLAFLPDGDLLVSYHGSWNSTVPVGYKVVRWHWDGRAWVSSDFLTGFLTDGSAIGRPVDVLPMPDGAVLVSDDKAGAIWRVSPR